MPRKSIFGRFLAEDWRLYKTKRTAYDAVTDIFKGYLGADACRSYTALIFKIGPRGEVFLTPLGKEMIRAFGEYLKRCVPPDFRFEDLEKDFQARVLDQVRLDLHELRRLLIREFVISEEMVPSFQEKVIKA